MSSARMAARMKAHAVTVKTKTGAGAYGDIFATAVTKRCYIEDAINLVRDASGTEVVSTSKLFAPATDQAVYAIGSLVTPPSGSEAQVIKVSVRDAGQFSHGLQHVEVYLT